MSIDVGHYSEADNFPNEVQGTMLPQDLRYKGMDFELNTKRTPAREFLRGLVRLRNQPGEEY